MESKNKVFVEKTYDLSNKGNQMKNNATFCIGTGRMSLALHKEYFEQLQKVQQEIGFSYIRGHGLFHDDMGIYNEYEQDGETKVEYNFTYVDRVFDDYLSLGIKPFVELGFMPSKLASGKQTVFYWKGNVTPPKNYEKWSDLVQATIKHWMVRYGREEVLTWFFEVWNEPNLTAFWENADEKEYFKLYHTTAIAVKELDEGLRVGGPAICGVDDERWLKEFLAFCSENNSPIDFVSRHLYMTEMPDWSGHYGYQKVWEHSRPFNELKVSRNIIDSFECYKGMEMHITEFNTSYIPNCPLHDEPLNAAYIAKLLSRMGETCASYSYWTFGDVFEEKGIPFTPFHGGFGLLANGNIPKPTYWIFQFYKKLGMLEIDIHEYGIITKKDENTICGILWNPVLSEATNENLKTVHVEYKVENSGDEECFLFTESVSEQYANPRSTWHHMGSPANLKKEQVELLNKIAIPYRKTARLQKKEGVLHLKFSLTENEVVYFEVSKAISERDRGYRE